MAGLVIKRRSGQTIKCGPATIKVGKIEGDYVKIQIVAPRDMVIYRGECADRWESGNDVDHGQDFD